MKQLSLGEDGFERLGLEDAQARVPRRDEPGGALGCAGVLDLATCACTGRQGRTPAVCRQGHAAHPLRPTVVQPLGPGYGRGAVRHGAVP